MFSLSRYIIFNIGLFYFILKQVKIKRKPMVNNNKLNLYTCICTCIKLIVLIYSIELLRNILNYLKVGQIDIKILFNNIFWIQMCVASIIAMRNYYNVHCKLNMQKGLLL